MLSSMEPSADRLKSLQAEEDEELARLMRQLRSAREKCHPSFAAVPKFYSSTGAVPVDSSPSAIATAWRSRAAQQRLGLEALHRHLEVELNVMLGLPRGHPPCRLPRAKLPPIGTSTSLVGVGGNTSKSSDAEVDGLPPSSSACPPPGLELESAWPEARAAASKAFADGWRQLSARLHSDGALARASPPDDRGGRVNYDGVQRLRDLSPPFWRSLLTGRCFLALARDSFGRVACADLKRALFVAARLRFQALDLSVFAYLSAAANAAKDSQPPPSLPPSSSSPAAATLPPPPTPPPPSSRPLASPTLGTDPLMLGRWASAPSSSAYGSTASTSNHNKCSAGSGGRNSSGGGGNSSWLSVLKLSEEDLMAWVRSHCNSNGKNSNHLANSRRCPLLRPEHEDDFFGIFVFTAVRRLLFYLDTAPRRRQVSVAQLLESPLSVELLDFAQLLQTPWPVPPPNMPQTAPTGAAGAARGGSDEGEIKNLSGDNEEENSSPWDPYGRRYAALQPALRAIGTWARQQRAFVSCFVGTRRMRRHKSSSHDHSSEEHKGDINSNVQYGEEEYEGDTNVPSQDARSSHGYASSCSHSSSDGTQEPDLTKQQQKQNRDVSVVLLTPLLPVHRNSLRQTLESVVDNSRGILHFASSTEPRASGDCSAAGSATGDVTGAAATGGNSSRRDSSAPGDSDGGAVGDDLWPLLQADGLLGPPPSLLPKTSTRNRKMTHEVEGCGALSGGQVQSVEWKLISSSSSTPATSNGDDHSNTSAPAPAAVAGAAPKQCLPSLIVSLAATNWLSADAPNRYYREYLELDKDENGMLSASELADFRCSGNFFPVGSDTFPAVFGPPAKLSEVFLQRLFEEVVTFRSPSAAENERQSSFSSSSSSTSNELDYRLFLDFVMAFDALREKQPPPPPPPPMPAALSANFSSTSPVPETRTTALTDNVPQRGSNSSDSSSSSGGSCSERGDSSTGSSSGASRRTKSGAGGKNVSAALRHFWPLLDVQHCGYLDSSTLAYLFGSVRRRLITSGSNGGTSGAGGSSGDADEANAAAAPFVGDVLDEIFDMVKPQEAGKITLQDLAASQMGHTVVSMLIDAEGFTRYDRRESLMHHDDDDGGHGGGEGASSDSLRGYGEGYGDF